jgi:hypothetical protein
MSSGGYMFESIKDLLKLNETIEVAFPRGSTAYDIGEDHILTTLVSTITLLIRNPTNL